MNPASTAQFQIVDLLAEAGVQVSVATSGHFDPRLFAEPSRVRPYVLSGPDELLDQVPPHRVVLATSPTSVYDALLLRERDGSRVASWFEPQAMPSQLDWPADGWALAAAVLLVHDHLGSGAAGVVSGNHYAVPLGVCLDTYQQSPALQRSGGIVIPHDQRAGAAAVRFTAQTASRLLEDGHAVTIYGDDVDVIGADHQPFLHQSAEAELLRSANLVLEVAPVSGLERLRLRAAAVGTPLVAAGPLGTTCPLDPADHLYLAPRGDHDRALDLACRILAEGPDGGLLDAAAKQARQFPISSEARAIADAVRQLSSP